MAPVQKLTQGLAGAHVIATVDDDGSVRIVAAVRVIDGGTRIEIKGDLTTVETRRLAYLLYELTGRDNPVQVRS